MRAKAERNELRWAEVERLEADAGERERECTEEERLAAAAQKAAEVRAAAEREAMSALEKKTDSEKRKAERTSLAKTNATAIIRAAEDAAREQLVAKKAADAKYARLWTPLGAG
jgi:hypothetical protein